MNGNGNNTTVPAPQNVAEVEQLVKRLYQPGSPRLITEINDQLQRVQLSSHGWQVADALLGSDDSNVRFFGALTFTVKLNNDGATLDAETAQTIQQRLISWFIRLVQQREGALVIKKLCSALTTYFLRSPMIWKCPLLHVAVSLQRGEVIPGDNIQTGADISSILQPLDLHQIVALLWFSGTLADELGRTEIHTPSNGRLHTQMESIVQEASGLMLHAFTSSLDDDAKMAKKESLKSFSNWVDYAQPVWPSKPECLQYLRDLIPTALQCMVDPVLQVSAMNCFREILESYTSFFKPSHMESLAIVISDKLQPTFLELLGQRHPEALNYGQMVIAFGNANVQHVVENPDDMAGSITVLKLHFEILRSPGHPGDEDELSSLSIEFWNTYVEYINDVIFSKGADDPEPSWLSYARTVLTQLIELLWAKMWTPQAEVAKGWSDAESEAFKDFRVDATDLMLSIYVCCGNDMLKRLVLLALRSLEANEWRAVEAALFSLNALSDNMMENDRSDGILDSIFSSNLFRDAGDFSKNIPSQARRTAIDMLGNYGQYLESHAEYLPDAVRFLFSSLEMAHLANTAAKSIATLCSTCRSSLTNELDGFLLQYKRFLSGPTSDPYTKEKVIGAIAAIIQALKSEEAKAQPLLALLENVERDVEASKSYAAAGDTEMADLTGVTALHCLASIGRGMQVPADIPIDIYDDDQKPEDRSNFWNTEEGQDVQRHIINCFSVLQVVGNNGDAISAACQVLRTGFSETEPGPFVLSPAVTVSFLQQCSINTPQLESVLATACTLIIQHSKPDSKPIVTEVAAICQHVAMFVEDLGRPSQDPGVAQHSIDLLKSLLPTYSSVLFDESSPLSSHLPQILTFTLAAIDSPDPFPKRSSAALWTQIIKPQSPLPDTVRTCIHNIIQMYGPQLAISLMRQIGGLAQRSELDALCDPLKAMIINEPTAKSWLEDALVSDSFPKVNVTVGNAEKRRFLHQIIGLRGDGRKTREVVRNFWAACRGTIASYGS
ncbi:hypothetical protein M433DRAFT_63187 [Acidomyces richmondensis BFW]|nr:MAG: hypothetical protein FE78DRAFT_141988 [Acidomyces sp. 'richmondensis']KYG47405.1 hypothetical protein M433DRAFT_63187 [Acidomyces richmondensis BFW]